MNNRKTVTPYLLFIGSMLIFGSIGIFRRYIPLSSGLLACARGFVGGGVLLILYNIRGGRLFRGLEIRKNLMLVLTGGLMGANWILLFEAYNYTSVPIATLCYYMEPTMVMLVSPFIFKERLTAKKLMCVAVSLVGMMLVAGMGDGSGDGLNHPKGIALGLMAAVLYTSVVILNKSIHMEDVYQKTILQLFSTAIVLFPYIILTGQGREITTGVISGIDLPMLMVVGIVHTGLAYAMYFGSMQAMPAQSIAVLSYIDPVSALFMSALILGEPLPLQGIIGAVLILGAAVLPLTESLFYHI